MSKIINAKIYNFMGLSEVEISPCGKSLIVGGANGQGKSSLIKALMAVGGKRLVPAQPVKDGAEKALIEIGIETKKGTYVASFETSPDRTTKLVVKAADGVKIPNPQTFLDGLFSGVSFDPGAFRGQKPAEQRDTLLKLVGLDFTPLDTDRARSFAERTELGRDLKKAEAQLLGMPRYQDADEAVSQAEIIGQMDKLKKQAEERRAISTLIEGGEARFRETQAEILGLRTKIAELESLLESVQEKIDCNLKALSEMPAPTRAEYDALKARLEGAQEHNKKVAENEQRLVKAREVASLKADYDARNKEIESIDNAKAEAINTAKFPVPGLGFDDTGVTYNGRPLAQASEAEQWRVSLAIGFALNPDGVLFMPTTGGLDKQSRANLITQAEELGVQLILEVVDTPDDVSLVIEAGRVKA